VISARRVLTTALVALGAGLVLAACDDVNTVSRPTEPVVLTGARLPALVGQPPARIVAFRHGLVDGAPRWTQIPVQVDQRKVVPFGGQPASNDLPGTAGTVYGWGSGGPTALQYADPQTFVGADADPAFDADDELVFMISDAGGKPRDDGRTEPAGVVAGTGVAVQVDDPRGEDQTGWVYLFVSTGALDPAAGQDYVDYDFALTSGDYRTTYRRAVGPNPETSKVVTPTYEVDFTDRWKEVGWRIHAGSATGVDILDGHKNQFAPTTCGRSNQTFADAEGAFVANIDGPVRAIRSYVGANSGPLTQRTHLLYRDVEHTVTDLRVHAIGSVMDFLDYSAAAQGMTYRSSTVPGGVPIDGVDDAVPAALATWEAVDGAPGRVYTRGWMTTDIPGLSTVEFYRDQTTPTEPQCWGDASYLGASGSWEQAAIPNTDPRSTPFSVLTSHRLTQFAAPAFDPRNIPASAADWAADAATPLTVTVSDYRV
jgi:hypothetical protein